MNEYDYDGNGDIPDDEDINGYKTGRKCSECGTELRNHNSKDRKKYDFCPHCGK